MDIIIRKAQKTDLPAILRLVRELAIYEKAAEEVSAGIREYEQEFERGTFEALVACRGDQTIGMALYYPSFSTWKGRMIYLEDFIITSEHRRKGVGQQLYNAFLKEVKAQNAKLAKWQVLDWNRPAIDFYIKNEAVFERNWWNVKSFVPENQGSSD